MGVAVNDKVPWWVFVLPAAMSLIALADLPYGYYQLLRIVVTACACWIAIGFYCRKSLIGTATFGVIAIIFNPIAKIHMERDVHSIFNVLSAATLIGGLWWQSRWKDVP
jgi:hypothetical protein